MAVTVDEEEDGNASSATAKVTVAGADPPVADFTYSPGKPIAEIPIDFDGSSSGLAAGAGPAIYEWLFCAPGAGLCQIATGAHAQQLLPIPAVNASPNLKPTPMRRRATWTVILRVTDAFGRTGEAQKHVTVVPNTPPRADFRIEPKVGPQAKNTVFFPYRTILSDMKLRSLAADPDPGDAIAELRWEVSGDGKDDLRCVPYICEVLPFAFGKPPEPKVTAPPKEFIPLEQPKKGPPEEILKDFGFQDVLVNPAAPGGGLRAAGLPRQVAFELPPSFTELEPYAPVPLNVGRMHLAQDGVAGGKLLEELSFPTATQPFPGPEENLAAYLRWYHGAADALSRPDSWEFPKAIRLTVTDRAGASEVATQPLSFGRARYPTAAMKFQPTDPNGPVLTSHQFLLGIDKVKDPDGKVAKLVLELGQIGDARCIVEDTLAAATAPGAAISTKCKGVGIQKPYRTIVADSVADLIAQKNAADLSFPGPGVYAASLSVYDDQGLGSHAFVSGVRVVAEGACQARNELLPDNKTRIAGECVTLANGRYTSSKTISLNGVGLRPQGGGKVVVTATKSPKVFAEGKPDVYVMIDDVPVGVFQPTQGTGGQLFGQNPVTVDVIEGAVLRGLPVEPGTLTVRIGNKESAVHTELRMPGVFNDGQPPTAPVDRVVKDPGETVKLERFEILGPFGEVKALPASLRGGRRGRSAALPGNLTLGPIDSNVGGVGIDDLTLKYIAADEPGTAAAPSRSRASTSSARSRRAWWCAATSSSSWAARSRSPAAFRWRRASPPTRSGSSWTSARTPASMPR